MSGPDEPEELRRRAELRISVESGKTSVGELSPEDSRALIRELRVHQAELQIQNEELVRAQEELAHARDRFIDLYDFAPVGYLMLSREGVIEEANVTFARLLGLPRAAVLGARVYRFVENTDQGIYLEHRRAVIESNERGECEVRLVREDGSAFDAALGTVPVTDEVGEMRGLRTVVTDVSARKAAENAWRQGDAIIEAAAQGVVVFDGQRRVTRTNEALAALMRCDEEDVLGLGLEQVLSERPNAQSVDTLWQALRRDGRWGGELWYRRHGQTDPLPVRGAFVSLSDERGNVTAYAGLLDDISEQKRIEGDLRHHAYFDALTGLPNRMLFAERLEAAEREAQRHGQLFSLLYVDVDRFKETNDRFGHEAGDALLRSMADRLRECTREHDTVARIGGDEFAVILTDVDNVRSVVTVADKIMTALAPLIRFEGNTISCEASMGIAVYPVDARDADTLRRQADLAMYRAKREGRNSYRFFRESMTQQARRHTQVERELGRAIERDQLRLHYQPIIEAASGRLIGGEALLRWAHPERGLLEPEHFLFVAEDTGQILELGRWVIGTASREWSSWCAGRPSADVPFLSLNLSPGQISSDRACRDTIAALKSCQPRVPRLSVELTEGVALNRLEAARDDLQALKELGVQLVMDDFGTGYSSLAYLKALPFDMVKIDRSFIRGVDKSPDAAHLVTAIVAMAHGLRLGVGAVGVESVAELDFVRECGCDFVQGSVLSPPVPGERMREIIERGSV
ncbi:MAG TPA: EAL domain-containing protein [Gammaproteobacteria bacterium]|nr:EAL domain-containing protein [Gammaproteobacteria bacterium]